MDKWKHATGLKDVEFVCCVRHELGHLVLKRYRCEIFTSTWFKVALHSASTPRGRLESRVFGVKQAPPSPQTMELMFDLCGWIAEAGKLRSLVVEQHIKT